MAANHRFLVAVVLVASIVHTVTGAATTTVASNPAATSGGNCSTTAYDVLEKNNLPRGILPEGVQSYVLRRDGSMEVTLPGECDFFVTVAGQRFKFRYGAAVGGVVHAGSVREVYGVRVQVKFAWLGLNGVRRSRAAGAGNDGDQLELQVQEFTQSFPVGDFAVSPRCI